MPRENKKKTEALLQKMNTLEIVEDRDKTSLKTWKIYAAEPAFALLNEISDPNNYDFRFLKKLFEKYTATEEYIKITEELATIAYHTKSNPKFKILFNDARDLDEQDIQKMAVALELESLLIDLKQKKYSFQFSVLQEIFVLMSAILPYYPEDRRNSWNLTSLLKSCEKMHGLYFHILNQIVSIDIDLPLFAQMQSTYLFTMMMWISNTESLNSKLIRHAFSALDECKHLSRLINTVFNNALSNKADFIESADEAILMLPSPLNIIDVLCTDDNPNHPSNKLKVKFLQVREKVPLHLSFTMEFIDFFDKILDFAKDKATSLERTIILKNAEPYHYIIDSLSAIYLDDKKWPILVSSNPIFIIVICSKLVDVMNKWAVTIHKNQADQAGASQTSIELIKTAEIQKIKETQEIEAKLANWQEQENIKTAQEFTEKQLKKVGEENTLRVKQEERAKQSHPSSLDRAQQSISDLANIKNSGEKESRTLDDIYHRLRCKNLGLESLKETVTAACPTSYDVHTLLILHISLFDHFTSQIKNNLRIYQREYAPVIANMTDKYGKKDEHGELIPFSHVDRDNNSFITDSLEKISINIANMTNYSNKATVTLEIIGDLKYKIKDKLSYQALYRSEDFRKHEYKDIYEQVVSQIQMLEKCRTNKEIAWKSGLIPSNPKKEKSKKMQEKEASKKLAELITAFQAMNVEIKKFSEIEFSAALNLTQSVKDLSLSSSITHHEVKTKLFQFFNGKEHKPTNTVERKQILLAALKQILDEEYNPFKKEILNEINKDKVIDDKKFRDLFKSIKDKIKIIPTMGRSLSF